MRQGGSAVTRAVLRRLRALGEAIPGPDENWCVRSTHAGHVQRSAGAWSWTLDLVQHQLHPEQQPWSGIYGGYWPAKMCCQAGASIDDNRRKFRLGGDVTLDPPDSAIQREMARRGRAT